MIVESGKTSTGWYRKWNDGFIEQGGTFTPNYGNTTVSFYLTFATTKLQILMQTSRPEFTGTWAPTAGPGAVFNIKTSSFVCGSNYDTGSDTRRNWYAAGY